MKRKIKSGLITVITSSAILLNAEVLVRDEFNVAPTADPSNGIYANDTGVNGIAPVGGSILGFDASRSWTASSGYLRTHNNDLLCLVGYASSRTGSRQLAAGIMTEKTKACGRILFNFSVPDSYDQGTSKIGFTTETGYSAVGASLRINWDSTSSEWDIEVIYNNGSLVVGEVVNGISLGTDYTVIWEMDEIADTLKVWVNATSGRDIPDAVFTDYAGSVADIDDLYVQFSGFDDVDGASVTERDGLRYKEVMLGDRVSDFLPTPEVKLFILQNK